MSEDRTKILVADDHALVRRGLVQVLENEHTISITETDNGRDALKLIRSKSPDVALLDIEMPEMTGFEVAQTVYNEGLNVDIVFLTMHKDRVMFNKAMDIDVKGYLLKENTISEIMTCLKMIKKGRSYISPVISDYLLERNKKQQSGAGENDKLDCLTDSERNILTLVGQMYTSQEIADELHVSLKTVQNHRNNMCNKLGLSGRHALLKFALKHKSH